MTPAEQAAQKAAAAGAAVALVQDGMRLGLGTGSTAEIFVRLLGERVGREHLDLTAVPTSSVAERLAAQYGVPVSTASEGVIDLAVDGADEIDGDLRLIKGRGGALVREKLVAVAAARFVVIADSTKLVRRLGAGVLPVEVVPFFWRDTARRLEALAGAWRLRGGEEAPFVSDNGNLIVDLSFPNGIEDPDRLAAEIKSTVGVVEPGLFIGLATTCLIGTEDGVRRLGA